MYPTSIFTLLWIKLVPHAAPVSVLADLPKVEVLVPVPSVRAGLLPKSPVPVPKDGALVVVVPNPVVLLPNKLGCKR